MLVHSVQDGPDKAAQLAGDGRDSDMAMLSFVESPELFVESVLGFESNGDNFGRLPLTAPPEDQVRAATMAIVPGSLDKEPSGVDVTGLGDGPASLMLAR